MKHPILIALMAWLAVMGSVAAYGETLSVQVKSGEVRSTPSFLGKIVGRLPYGTQVSATGEQGDWLGVSGAGVQGWMHRSALTDKKIVFKSGAANVNQYATSDELSLAGKGFNEEVEDAYKARNPNADFTWIDRMEATTVSQNEMLRFLREGAVQP